MPFSTLAFVLFQVCQVKGSRRCTLLLACRNYDVAFATILTRISNMCWDGWPSTDTEAALEIWAILVGSIFSTISHRYILPIIQLSSYYWASGIRFHSNYALNVFKPILCIEVICDRLFDYWQYYSKSIYSKRIACLRRHQVVLLIFIYAEHYHRRTWRLMVYTSIQAAFCLHCRSFELSFL